MAPEIFESKPYSTKADIYSFGIVVWEICSRQTPYKRFNNPHAIMKYVTIDKGRPDLSQIEASCPLDLIELIKQCWQDNQEERPNFPEIIKSLLKIYNKWIVILIVYLIIIKYSFNVQSV